MKYHFSDIENGTIEHTITIITILNNEAEIANDDVEAALLAEQHGGVLVTTEKPARAERKGNPSTGSGHKSGGVSNGS